MGDTILRIYTHTNDEAKAKAFESYQAILNKPKSVAVNVAVDTKNDHIE